MSKSSKRELGDLTPPPTERPAWRKTVDAYCERVKIRLNPRETDPDRGNRGNRGNRLFG